MPPGAGFPEWTRHMAKSADLHKSGRSKPHQPGRFAATDAVWRNTYVTATL